MPASWKKFAAIALAAALSAVAQSVALIIEWGERDKKFHKIEVVVKEKNNGV